MIFFNEMHQSKRGTQRQWGVVNRDILILRHLILPPSNQRVAGSLLLLAYESRVDNSHQDEKAGLPR